MGPTTPAMHEAWKATMGTGRQMRGSTRRVGAGPHAWGGARRRQLHLGLGSRLAATKGIPEGLRLGGRGSKEAGAAGSVEAPKAEGSRRGLGGPEAAEG